MAVPTQHFEITTKNGKLRTLRIDGLHMPVIREDEKTSLAVEYSDTGRAIVTVRMYAPTLTITEHN